MKSLIKWILSLFSPNKNEANNPEPPIEPPPAKPMPPIKEVSENEIDWKEWTKKAAYISSTYEGSGGDYANVVGNFDGAYLTCGLLGLTWKYGNQIKAIKEFVKRNGEKKIIDLMPTIGKQYLRAAFLGEIDGSRIVESWSSNGKVMEPFKSELAKLYSSPEMIEVQNIIYDEMMGIFAKKKCLESKEYFKNENPKFSHYAYWFDQAVLNGQGKTVGFDEANKISIYEVVEFVGNIGGYNKTSNAKNYSLWNKKIKDSQSDNLHLFKMAYLRALKSRPEFQGTTMMRRGTLALGVGYVNEKLRQYDWA